MTLWWYMSELLVLGFIRNVLLYRDRMGPRVGLLCEDKYYYDYHY